MANIDLAAKSSDQPLGALINISTFPSLLTQVLTVVEQAVVENEMEKFVSKPKVIGGFHP